MTDPTPPPSITCPWCRGVGRILGEPCSPCREDGWISEGDESWEAALAAQRRRQWR